MTTSTPVDSGNSLPMYVEPPTASPNHENIVPTKTSCERSQKLGRPREMSQDDYDYFLTIERPRSYRSMYENLRALKIIKILIKSCGELGECSVIEALGYGAKCRPRTAQRFPYLAADR